MPNSSFLIAGNTAAIIANDVCDFRYRAAVQHLRVGAKVPVRRNELAEMQFMVESGTVEFMIGGATARAFTGDFVRVPAGTVHACRNDGDVPARLLVRSVSPSAVRRALRVSLEVAA